MGYNRTVCMLSVTAADICLNSHLGVNGGQGQGHWGMRGCWGMPGSVAGAGAGAEGREGM